MRGRIWVATASGALGGPMLKVMPFQTTVAAERGGGVGVSIVVEPTRAVDGTRAIDTGDVVVAGKRNRNGAGRCRGIQLEAAQRRSVGDRSGCRPDDDGCPWLTTICTVAVSYSVGRVVRSKGYGESLSSRGKNRARWRSIGECSAARSIIGRIQLRAAQRSAVREWARGSPR